MGLADDEAGGPSSQPSPQAAAGAAHLPPIDEVAVEEFVEHQVMKGCNVNRTKRPAVCPLAHASTAHPVPTPITLSLFLAQTRSAPDAPWCAADQQYAELPSGLGRPTGRDQVSLPSAPGWSWAGEWYLPLGNKAAAPAGSGTNTAAAAPPPGGATAAVAAGCDDADGWEYRHEIVATSARTTGWTGVCSEAALWRRRRWLRQRRRRLPPQQQQQQQQQQSLASLPLDSSSSASAAALNRPPVSTAGGPSAAKARMSGNGGPTPVGPSSSGAVAPDRRSSAGGGGEVAALPLAADGLHNSGVRPGGCGTTCDAGDGFVLVAVLLCTLLRGSRLCESKRCAMSLLVKAALQCEDEVSHDASPQTREASPQTREALL